MKLHRRGVARRAQARVASCRTVFGGGGPQRTAKLGTAVIEIAIIIQKLPRAHANRTFAEVDVAPRRDLALSAGARRTERPSSPTDNDGHRASQVVGSAEQIERALPGVLVARSRLTWWRAALSIALAMIAVITVNCWAASPLRRRADRTWPQRRARWSAQASRSTPDDAGSTNSYSPGASCRRSPVTPPACGDSRQVKSAARRQARGR